MDFRAFNARWLQAWSDKDADTLVDQYYAPDVVYKDPQTAIGLTGSEALRGYLSGLFHAMPPTRYDPGEVWELEGGAGYCGRWIATMDLPNGNVRRFRGFDLCLVRDGRIALNEVYTHDLPAES